MGHLVLTNNCLLVFHKARFLVPCSLTSTNETTTNDLLLSIQDTDICNYANDTTIYACDNNLDNVIARLDNDSNIIIQWFADNFMKLNTDKCHLLILVRNSNQQITVNVGDSVIENTEEETLLGVVIDKRLNFETHISKLCRKAGNKIFALARISGYMDSNKLRILYESLCN